MSVCLSRRNKISTRDGLEFKLEVADSATATDKTDDGGFDTHLYRDPRSAWEGK